jgi:hypothetical protein
VASAQHKNYASIPVSGTTEQLHSESFKTKVDGRQVRIDSDIFLKAAPTKGRHPPHGRGLATQPS